MDISARMNCHIRPPFSCSVNGKMYITFGVLQATVLVVGVFGCIFSDPVGKRKKGNENDAFYQMLSLHCIHTDVYQATTIIINT